MTEITLFSTRIARRKLPDPALLDALLEAVWMIEDGDTAGHDWCEQEGYQAPAISPFQREPGGSNSKIRACR